MATGILHARVWECCSKLADWPQKTMHHNRPPFPKGVRAEAEKQTLKNGCKCLTGKGIV
jgi:hypothetical protein